MPPRPPNAEKREGCLYRPSPHARPGIRRRPYRRYLIFYRVETDRILSLLIVHGARDYHALLTAEE